jgi:hypothetical protein
MSARKSFCLALFLAIPGVAAYAALHAQTDDANRPMPYILARLSYDRTYGISDGESPSPRACFELYRGGRYRLYRIGKDGAEKLGGSLQGAELDQFAKLLSQLNFESTGTAGGMVLQGTESFIAEVNRRVDSKRYVWIDPDRQRPFPDSAVRVIRWLQQFPALGATPITVPELGIDSICPDLSTKSLQPLQP